MALVWGRPLLHVCICGRLVYKHRGRLPTARLQSRPDRVRVCFVWATAGLVDAMVEEAGLGVVMGNRVEAEAGALPGIPEDLKINYNSH